MNFTDEQNQIFEFVKNGEGHGIIDAVAGAGKTSTIMESAKYVSNKAEVLFCAFNRSIKDEIALRFSKKGMNEVTTKTIHSLGFQILRDNNSTGKDYQLKNDKYKKLVELEEIKQLFLPHLIKVIKYHGFEYDEYLEKQTYEVNNVIRNFVRRLLEINSKYRLTLCQDSYNEFKKMVLHYGIFNHIEVEQRDFDNELECYLECHRILLHKANEFSKKTLVIDYSDMLYLPYEWKQSPSRKFSFLFIDECQDLSRSQLAVALKYAKKGSRILAVGDPRQSIYGFTGADIQSFSNIENITKAKRLPLTLCFRCPQGVISIAKEIRDDIIGNKTYHGKVSEITHDQIVPMAKPNDLVLCRTKAPLLFIIFEFIENEIKVRIHPEIAKEMINKLRRLFKKEELFDPIQARYGNFETLKEKVIGRNLWIIDKDAERIIDADERKVHKDTEKYNLEKELEFLHKRYEVWKEEDTCLEDIFKKLHQYVNEKKNPITISTIHTAKGLESNRVFIINYSDLPLIHPEHKEWEKTQEINLKYVSVTRAMEELYLVKSTSEEEMGDEGSLFDELFEI